MFPLPSYIDPEAWLGFEEMRKVIKRPLTDRARTTILVKLQRIKDAGHDPNAALDQSTEHCWQTVFEPRELELTVKRSSEAEKTAQMLAEQSKGWTPPPDNIRQMSRRRV